MPGYEYKVVPAPTKGTKAKGVKTPQGRFANSVEGVLNTLAAEGWEYQRAELLPSDERSGLTGSVTNWRNVLVFRRALEVVAPEEAGDGDENTVAAAVVEPAVVPVEVPEADPSGPALASPAELEAVPKDPAPAPTATLDDDDEGDLSKVASIPGPGAVRMLKDDGVEEVSDVAGVTTALKTLATSRGGEDPAEDGAETRPAFKRTPPTA
jgi:hypothetical protein